MKQKGELISDMRQVPSIVVFFTFWFGRTKTNWVGIQKEYHLSDEIIKSLRADNQAYKSCSI